MDFNLKKSVCLSLENLSIHQAQIINEHVKIGRLSFRYRCNDNSVATYYRQGRELEAKVLIYLQVRRWQ